MRDRYDREMAKSSDETGALRPPTAGPEGSLRPRPAADLPMSRVDSGAATSRLPSRSSILVVAVLLIIGVAFPMALGALSGSLFLPSNDDPAYRRIALDLFSTGRLELNGWNSMSLIGEIFFVQPFLWLSGGAAWAFTASTAILACIGIVAGYSLVRRVLSVPRSVLAVLGVLFFPGFLLNTTTYMTDVPAWAMSVTCLALGAIALERVGYKRWLWLAASLAVGCFAFSIREFAIAAPVAVLIVFTFSPLGRRRRFWVAVGITAAASCAIYLFATHLPGRAGIGLGVPILSLATLRHAFDDSLRHGIASVSLVASPALVIAIVAWWRRWRLIDVLAGLAVGLLFFIGPIVQIVHTGHWPQVVAGNLIELTGSLGGTALYGSRPVLFPEPWWYLINGAALILGLVGCGVFGGAVGAYLRSAVRGVREGRGRRAFWPWGQSTWTLIVVFAVLYGTGIAVWAMAFTFFDRYTWPLVLPLYAILLKSPAETAQRAEAVSPKGARISPTVPLGGTLRWVPSGLAVVLIAALAATSLVLLANSDALATARWQMGNTAVERGAPSGEIDAGLEWVAFHATGSATANQPGPSFGSRYESWWPSFHLCALVSSSPISDARVRLEETDAKAYQLLFFAGPWEPLYLYSVPGPGCP